MPVVSVITFSFPKYVTKSQSAIYSNSSERPQQPQDCSRNGACLARHSVCFRFQLVPCDYCENGTARDGGKKSPKKFFLDSGTSWYFTAASHRKRQFVVLLSRFQMFPLCTHAAWSIVWSLFFCWSGVEWIIHGERYLVAS